MSAMDDVQAVLARVEQAAQERERRRIVGLLLNEVGVLSLRGQKDAARALDLLALRIEHPEAA